VKSRCFGEFRLDLAKHQLSRGDRLLALTPKAFAVLAYLSERSGCLVSKSELLDHLWPNINVTEAALAVCIYEIRRILGDKPRTPRFIQTVHTLGYRFLAEVEDPGVPSRQSDLTGDNRSLGLRLTTDSVAPVVSSQLFGRQKEITKLYTILQMVQLGRRQSVFITGEPGIGKTALAKEFVTRVCVGPNALIGCGQCIDHYGTGEPYLPVFAALGQICRQTNAEIAVSNLKRYAPTWVRAMPGVTTSSDVGALQSDGFGNERMLRELVNALEMIAAETLLVLWLEDIHWSDHATLDLIALLARGQSPAKILLISTYRPVDVIVKGHPLGILKRELQLHNLCQEVPLGGIPSGAINGYLAATFPGSQFASSLGQVLYDRTEGNPLFLSNVIEDWKERSILTQTAGVWTTNSGVRDFEPSIPQNLRAMLEQQIEELTVDERALLETASVIGMDFSPAALAAGLATDIEKIEELCEDLTRTHQYIRRSAAPDNNPATHYAFIHALHRRVCEERIPRTKLLRLHSRIGAYKENEYGSRSREIAAELAYHYGRSGNSTKALQFLELAGQRAVERGAFHEAEDHYRNGLIVLQAQPESRKRDLLELRLQVSLARLMDATRGYSATLTAGAYTRARVLAEQTDDDQSLNVFYGLWSVTGARGQQVEALDLANQVLELAHLDSDPRSLVWAHFAQGNTRHLRGDLSGAGEHLRMALKHYREMDFRGALIDPGVSSLSWSAANECQLGHPDRALDYLADARSLAQRQNNPFALAYAAIVGSQVHVQRGDFASVIEASEEATQIGLAAGFPLWTSMARILGAWARAQAGARVGATDLIRDGLAELDSMEFHSVVGWFLCLLCETQARAGDVNGALVTAEQALRTNPDEIIFRPEIIRLRGKQMLRKDAISSDQLTLIEKDFREAIELARSMSAKSYELRSTMSLARLLDKQRRRDEARTILTAIYSRFDEGLETADLKAAKILLDLLGLTGERRRRRPPKEGR